MSRPTDHDVRLACNAAEQRLRDQARLDYPDHTSSAIEERITAFAGIVEPAGEVGWWHVGNVHDSMTGVDLAIWFNPELQQTRLETPTFRIPEPPRPEMFPVLADGTADPAYRYWTKEGVEISAMQAAAAVTAHGASHVRWRRR